MMIVIGREVVGDNDSGGSIEGVNVTAALEMLRGAWGVLFAIVDHHYGRSVLCQLEASAGEFVPGELLGEQCGSQPDETKRVSHGEPPLQ
jgi:hypothetical protein